MINTEGTTRSRLASELQLMAEERWLVNALKKVTQERNSLQIEKFQLKHLLGTLQAKNSGESQVKDNDIKAEDIEESLAELTRQKAKLVQQELENELICNNTQELNLNVDPNLYNIGYLNEHQYDENFMEEEEEDDMENDDENQDSIFNMFLMTK